MENNNDIKSDIGFEKPDYDDFPIELKLKISSLPKNPGCYQFKNDLGKVIYVGKAINLKNRVRSYFQEGRPSDAKTKALVRKIADVEVIVTDSEAEALILEDTLIKKYKPRYNVLLKDDKSYPYIRLTNEEYPRIFATRNVIRDGSKYFGPITEVKNLKNVLKLVRTLFHLRSCDFNLNAENIAKKKFKICLDYHINKCDGPCEGLISKEQYNENIKNSVQIINGKTKELEKFFELEMSRLSEELKFEEAAIMRNRYLLLREYSLQQKIVSTDTIDRDVFGIAKIEDVACTLVFKIRDGKLIGKRHYIITNATNLLDEQLIQNTIEKWYMETEFIPKEIFLPCEPDETEFLLDWLKKKRNKSVEIVVPKMGDKKKIVNMASANAEYQIREYNLAIAKKEQTIPKILLSLQRDLRLTKPPIRIECFDNSHIQGSELVSSLVVFQEGKPKKSDYRKFKNRTVEGNDDFAAMREVVSRRYSRLINENQPLPDLIIIDGGKGQLSSAVEVLKELNIFEKVTVVGLAKKLEEIFFPFNPEPVVLPRTSSSLRLIQHLRDEAHRFAITYHRQLREKRTLQTELTEIKGIGEKTSKKLLIKFGSVENIKNASKEQILEVVSESTFNALNEHFNQEKN